MTRMWRCKTGPTSRNWTRRATKGGRRSRQVVHSDAVGKQGAALAGIGQGFFAADRCAWARGRSPNCSRRSSAPIGEECSVWTPPADSRTLVRPSAARITSRSPRSRYGAIRSRDATSARIRIPGLQSWLEVRHPLTARAGRTRSLSPQAGDIWARAVRRARLGSYPTVPHVIEANALTLTALEEARSFEFLHTPTRTRFLCL